jgi:hypothetical protein
MMLPVGAAASSSSSGSSSSSSSRAGPHLDVRGGDARARVQRRLWSLLPGLRNHGRQRRRANLALGRRGRLLRRRLPVGWGRRRRRCRAGCRVDRHGLRAGGGGRSGCGGCVCCWCGGWRGGGAGRRLLRGVCGLCLDLHLLLLLLLLLGRLAGGGGRRCRRCSGVRPSRSSWCWRGRVGHLHVCLLRRRRRRRCCCCCCCCCRAVLLLGLGLLGSSAASSSAQLQLHLSACDGSSRRRARGLSSRPRSPTRHW